MTLLALVYILGAGASVLPILNILQRPQWFGDDDEVDRFAAVAYALLGCLFWPFWALVAIPLVLEHHHRKQQPAVTPGPERWSSSP